MKEEYVSINFKDAPYFSKTEIAFKNGERNSRNYTEKQLIEMLQQGDIYETYEALGSIGKIKLKKALPYLKNITLYSDDIVFQELAIRTIKKIGGRSAIDILRFLRSTEHKEFIENIL